MGIEAFRFDGKRAFVVGGATGMGAATAKILKDLGAEVIVADYADVSFDVDKTIKLDLRDLDSITAAVDALGGPIDALFSCAGVADGAKQLMLVNFIGQREVIDQLFAKGLFNRGSAISMISSVAGMGWENNMPTINEFLATKDYSEAKAYIEAHPDLDNYGFSKQAMLAYTAIQAYPFIKQGVRINSIMPGPTDTPLARANAETWLGFATDYRADVGVQASTPEEQAYPLIFLASAAASHVNGIAFIIDAGYVSAGLVDAYDAPFIKAMAGRA